MATFSSSLCQTISLLVAIPGNTLAVICLVIPLSKRIAVSLNEIPVGAIGP